MLSSKAPPRYAPHTCGHCGMTRKTLNGAWLRWKRLRAGVGLRELARRAGVSAAYLSDVERGNRHATVRAELAYQNLREVPDAE
jgi:predicted transcriptional regulator